MPSTAVSNPRRVENPITRSRTERTGALTIAADH
jgi:hypothetical protein